MASGYLACDVVGGFVHGDGIGGGEDVHRRAFADLLQEGTGAGEVEVDFGVGVFGLVGLGDVAEGVGEAGGGRDGDVGGESALGDGGRKGDQDAFFHGFRQMGLRWGREV